MDRSTIIMGIIFTLAIFGPMGFLLWLGKQRIRKMQKALATYAATHQLRWDQTDVWNDKALGLDIKNRQLVFLAFIKGLESVQLQVDLSAVKKATAHQAADSVSIILDRGEKGGVAKPIILFDGSVDSTVEMGFHYELAKKWANYIQQMHKSPSTKVPA